MLQVTIKAIAIIIALLLFGTAPRAGVLWILALFICWRFNRIWQQGFPVALTADGIELLKQSKVSELKELSGEARLLLLKKLHLKGHSSDEQIAEACIQEQQSEIIQRSFLSKLEIALLIISFVLTPITLTLLTNDIVVLQSREEWGVLLSIALIACLHFGLLKLVRLYRHLAITCLCIWGLIALLAIPVLIAKKHPYLNPWAKNQTQLIADHVLKLKNNVVAQHHSNYVFAYADELFSVGQLPLSLKYYLAGLHLDAENSDAHLKVSEIYMTLGQSSQAESHRATAASIESGIRNTQFLIRHDTASLPTLSELNTHEYSVLIVPVGQIDPSLLQTAGQLVKQSLGYPVYISQHNLVKPPHDRKRGLLSEPQTATQTVHDAFWNQPPIEFSGPIQIVLVTNADLYMQDTNFVFACSFRRDFSSVVSYRRFESNDVEITASRLAKQILSSTLKAMRVPQANSLDCVTAYVNSLDQFDRKSIWLSQQTRNTYESHLRLFLAQAR